ncbi:hypothetical protein ZIOFF_018765 [Zingiber officinale]|uniref:RING-type domain-containing protein n=1 Tax=Zingiber officinale TaxID=94328 RepID=A0A8J5LS33_ZINOF|nr:hypothetical protein ZIOFF_018765 [Zingiber officinale]
MSASVDSGVALARSEERDEVRAGDRGSGEWARESGDDELHQSPPQVPNYWKTYVEEVYQKRGMWLNSFCKAPLRLPMPAELEYWWEKVTFVGCNVGRLLGTRHAAFGNPVLVSSFFVSIGRINAAEVSYKESLDMFDATRDKGLLPNVIKRLPMFKLSYDEIINSCGRNACCAVYFQDFIDGDTARMMPMCNHIFHVVCIDVWLVKHDSCPTCRQEVLQFEVSWVDSLSLF